VKPFEAPSIFLTLCGTTVPYDIEAQPEMHRSEAMTDSRKSCTAAANVNRRKFVAAGIAALAVSVAGLAAGQALAAQSAYAEPAERALPPRT
jgi:hypothetical protein